MAELGSLGREQEEAARLMAISTLTGFKHTASPKHTEK